MTTGRRFAAFSRKAVPPRMKDIPEGGLCLSVFLVISRIGNPHEVVMGHINSSADWAHIGALIMKGADEISRDWMLPSSQLIIHESPEEASRRILREQLGLTNQKLEGPLVFSEAYSNGKGWDISPLKHWDLEFIFQGERMDIAPHPAWRKLRFVDLEEIREETIARSHEDILAHIGKWRSA